MENRGDVMFSIIIPVYNQREYLPYCIESLSNQTFQGFEAILIDDGSTDGSSKLCDEYAQKFPYIKVIHKKNEGVMYARRTGIQCARGRFLMFLDSDDELKSDCLITVKKTIDETGCDCVFFNASTHDDFSDVIFDYRDIVINSEKKKILEMMCGTHILNSMCTKCISCYLFDDYDFEGVSMVTYGEDYFQLLPVLDRVTAVTVIDQPLYYYRQHQSSVTHRYNRRQIESLPFVLQRLTFYAQKWMIEYNCDYLSLVNYYGAQECYTIIKNISFSDMAFNEKIREINYFKGTQIYKNYYKYVTLSLSFYRRVLFKILTDAPKMIRCAVIKLYTKNKFLK